MDATWLLPPHKHTAENKHRNTINTRMAHEKCVSEALVAPRCQAQTRDQKKKRIHHHRLTCSFSVYPHLHSRWTAVQEMTAPVRSGSGARSTGPRAQHSALAPPRERWFPAVRPWVTVAPPSPRPRLGLSGSWGCVPPLGGWWYLYSGLAVTSDSGSSRRVKKEVNATPSGCSPSLQPHRDSWAMGDKFNWRKDTLLLCTWGRSIILY